MKSCSIRSVNAKSAMPNLKAGLILFFAVCLFLAGAPPKASAQANYYVMDPANGQMCGLYAAPGGPLATGSKTGVLLTNAWVYVIFWGSYWSNNPSPSVANLASDFRTLLGSPYTSETQQYGINSVAFGGYGVYGPNTNPSTPDPPATFGGSGDNTINNEVGRLLPKLPGPAGGGSQTLYFLVMPATSSGGAGAHGWVLIPNGSKAVRPANSPVNYTSLGWIGYNNETTMTEEFSHELIEAITDPLVNFPGNGDWGVGTSELADVAHGYDTVDGVAVQAYWSNIFDDSNIPFGTSASLGGNALTSYYDSNDQLVHVFYLSFSGHIEELYWSGSTWSTRDLTALTGAPAATANTSLASSWDSVHGVGQVFYVGIDGDVHSFSYYPPGSPWLPAGWYPSDLSQQARSINDPAPPVQVMTDAYALSTYYDSSTGTYHVLYESNGDMIDLFYTWFGNPSWQSEDTNVSGGRLSTTQFTSFYDNLGGHVFMRTSYNDIIGLSPIQGGESSWSGADWSQDSGATAASIQPNSYAITSLSETPPKVAGVVRHVFYTTSSGHIIQLTQYSARNGTFYKYEDITPAAFNNSFMVAASLTGGPVGLASYIDQSGQIHVLYTAEDGEIIDLYRTSANASGSGIYGDAWSYDQPTVATGAAPSSSAGLLTVTYSPVVAINTAGSLPEAFYMANDTIGEMGNSWISGPQWKGDIGQFWNANNTGWGWYSLTGSGSVGSKGPLATP